jgi:peptide/nickel transport system substrate-binding protein
VLAILAGLLAACGSNPASANPPPVTYVAAVGGSVTIGIDSAPTGCNPNTATGDTVIDHLVLSTVLPSAFAVSNLGVAAYDPALIVQAELQSTTPETVVYTINPKAVWSDGVPVTAADFVYSWQHQRLVPVGVSGGDADVASTDGYEDIGSVTPSNHGRTVTVVFSTQYADWQGLFSDLLPAHILDRVGWSPACTTVDPRIDLSAGPYEISSVDAGSITLVKNPKWWGQEPKLDRIVFKVASGPEELAQWLHRGLVDVSDPAYFDPGFIEAVSAMPFVKSEVNISTTFLQLEFSTVGVATADPWVRDGVAYAIDRQELTDRVVGWANINIAPSSSHLYSQGQAGYPGTPAPLPANTTTTTTTTTQPSTDTITPQDFPTTSDPVEETRYLTAAGYLRDASGEWVDLEGHPLVLRLVIDTGDGWAAETGDLLAAQLLAAGIHLTVTSEPDAAAAGLDLADGGADMALIPLQGGPYPSSTSTWYTPLQELPDEAGAQDWSGYDSAKVDNLFSQAERELDPVTAQPLYNQIDQQLWTDMVALPLFAEPSALAWSDFITGVQADPYAPGLLSTILAWARLVNEPTTYSGTPTIPSS